MEVLHLTGVLMEHLLEGSALLIGLVTLFIWVNTPKSYGAIPLMKCSIKASSK